MPTKKKQPEPDSSGPSTNRPAGASTRRSKKQSQPTKPTRRTKEPGAKALKGYPRGYQDPNPTTPENRARKNPICGSKRSGKSSSGPGICCMPAGWGTEHLGEGYCKLHGGTNPNNNAKLLKDTL